MLTSIENFWLMVLQNNVGMIITPIQNIGKECSNYFPLDAKEIAESYGSVTVSCKSMKNISKYIVKR